MSVPTKLAAFALALGAALGVGAAIGGAAGPIDVGRDGDDEHVVEHVTTSTAPTAHEGSHWTGHR